MGVQRQMCVIVRAESKVMTEWKWGDCRNSRFTEPSFAPKQADTDSGQSRELETWCNQLSLGHQWNWQNKLQNVTHIAKSEGSRSKKKKKKRHRDGRWAKTGYEPSDVLWWRNIWFQLIYFLFCWNVMLDYELFSFLTSFPPELQS